MPAGPAPPRAPATTSWVVGSGAQSARPRPCGRGHHRRARRCVGLGVVVQLDDLGRLEERRGQLGEAHHQHRADGEVRRDQAVRARERGPQRDDVVVGEAGGADHGVDAVLAHQARLPRAASRTVKSTPPRRRRRPWRAVGCDATPLDRAPAPLGSTAATSSSAGSAATAAQAVRPSARRAEDADPGPRPLAVIRHTVPAAPEATPHGERHRGAATTVLGRSGRTICGDVGHERPDGGVRQATNAMAASARSTRLRTTLHGPMGWRVRAPKQAHGGRLPSRQVHHEQGGEGQQDGAGQRGRGRLGQAGDEDGAEEHLEPRRHRDAKPAYPARRVLRPPRSARFAMPATRSTTPSTTAASRRRGATHGSGGRRGVPADLPPEEDHGLGQGRYGRGPDPPTTNQWSPMSSPARPCR